jgi:hypothetical protein
MFRLSKLLIYAPSVYLLTNRLLFYGMLLSTASAVLTQNLNFFFSLILVANVITALSCYGREQVTLSLYLRTTPWTRVGGRRNRSAHTRSVVLQRVKACGPVLKFNFADLRGPLRDNSCMSMGNTQWQETPAQSRYFLVKWIEVVSNYRKARTRRIYNSKCMITYTYIVTRVYTLY